MPNIYDVISTTFDGLSVARLGDAAGSRELGISVYELQPGQEMVFHYHLQREELLVVLHGTLTLRSASGLRDLAEGEVVGFPRGERGAHGYANRTADRVRLLMVSEQNAPNISVYPDSNEVGLFDAARREDRRFGALFNLGDAVSGYGGGKPEL